MIILKQQTEPQLIYFIPREYTASALSLRNETTGEIVIYYTADAIYKLIDRTLLEGGNFEAKECLINSFDLIDTYFQQEDYFLKISIPLTLTENTFYNLNIFNKDKVIYKDKVFCTNQVIKDFTVNENQYVENNTTNEFIIYE